MDNNLNFSPSTIANPLSNAAPAATSAVDDSLSTPMNGKEFAGLMRDLLNKSGRQNLAASEDSSAGKVAGEESAVASDSSLQTLNLGDKFAVITSASPLPDANSLAAFARAQGLGDSAVNALFGDLVTPTVTAGDAPKLSSTVGAGVAPLEAVGNHISAMTAISQETNPATLSWLSTHPSVLPIGTQVATSAWAEALYLVEGIAESANLNTPKASDLNNLLGAVGATALVKTFGAASPLSALVPTAVEMSAELPPEMGPLDAMRMRLAPQWENITKQLSKLNGNLQSTPWAEIMMGKLAEKEGGLSNKATLDLGFTDIGLDLGADLALAMAAGADDNSSASPLNASDNTKAPISLSALANSSISAQGEKTQLTDRAGQIQELAHKLGQALGERLQEQMERGQWRLNLKLNPGHLGQIDVELDMHAGGLDAVFRTENMLTKELIMQGMSKLKDSLAQSGTAVADVWVNSESKRESGGNPTPQRFSGKAESEIPADEAQPVQQVSRMIEKRSADAWDTLA